MKLSKKGWKRFGVCAVCAVLIAAVCLSLGGNGALAVTSLPHIEEIIAKHQTFRVLEIVPAEGSGTTGYYVDGSEPSISGVLKTKTSAADRSAAAGAYLGALSARGILSSGSETPLTSGSGYTEKMPWEARSGDVRWIELKLKNADGSTRSEETLLTGAFTQDGSGARDFLLITQFVGAGQGDYIQNVNYFVAGQQSVGYYYYHPVFTSFSFASLPSEAELNGRAIYANTETDWIGAGGVVDPTEAGRTPVYGGYYYLGTYPEVSLDADVTYYYIKDADIGAPSDTFNADTAPYAAFGDQFTQVAPGQGYFTKKNYKYVGAGNGDSSYSSAGADTYTAEYDSVWYNLGYTNNNWFKRFVFDRSSAAEISALAVTVTERTAVSVTAADVNSADLIVLSSGLDVLYGGAMPAYAAGTNDISVQASAAVKAAGAGNRAIVADYSLTALGSTEIGALANALLGVSADADHNYVNKSILCFSAPFGELASLATPKFHAAYDASALAGFEAVTAEITYENFLRDTDSTATGTEKLPVEVTLANSIRYIINYAGQRQSAGEKTSITVLELQPGSNRSAISADIVRGWLGNPAALQKKTGLPDPVKIVTMSTAEFIGKIDDLAETYDLVYIGASTAGMNVNSSGTVYNDGQNMNGLLYSNIGDTYKCSNTVVGLLDRDYYTAGTNSWSSGGVNYRYVADNDATHTFRFSGNDLTQSKADQLSAFAQAGYPVVIDDGLVYAGSSAGNLLETPDWRLSGLSLDSSASGTYKFINDRSTDDAYAYTTITGLTVGKTYSFSGTFSALNARSGASFTVGIYSNSGWKDYAVFGKDSLGTKTLEFTADSTSARLYIYSSSNTSGSTTTRSISVSGLSLTETRKFIFSASVSADPSSGVAELGSITLSASVVSSSSNLPLDRAYQWYKNGSPIPGATGSTLAVTAGDAAAGSYYCTITISGTTAASGAITISKVVSSASITNNYGGTTGNYYNDSYSKRDVQASLTGSRNSDGTVTLTAVASPTHVTYFPSYRNITFTWFRDGQSGSIGGTTLRTGDWSDSMSSALTVSEPGTYYCSVYVARLSHLYDSTAAVSNTVTITNAGTSYSCSGGGAGAPETGLSTSGGSSGGVFAIDTERVDYASRLYSALSSAAFSSGTDRRANVVSSAEVTAGESGYSAANCETLRQYLNISQPKIEWYSSGGSTAGSYPAKYAMDANYNVTGTMTANADGKYVLTYKFRIVNNTDPTPASTSYDCRLYIDRNSSGLYEESEWLPDIVVHIMNDNGTEGALVSPVNGVYQLSGGQYYAVSREMPADYVGIISWKLEVVKNGAAGIHASETEYTHITPAEKQIIHVLQIMHNNGSGLNLKTNGTYYEYVAKVPDFNIVFDQIYANQVTDRTYWKYNNAPVSETALADYLNKFDMLILGFNDMYGTINDTAANAILAYSNSHAVLFTHDTTSTQNLPVNTYKAISNGYTSDIGTTSWGYSFNTVLRSRVGLDRYGVTDAALGRTKMYLASNPTTASGNRSGVVARGALSAGDILPVSSSGYTVAYQPRARSAKNVLSGTDNAISTVAEVQGLTKFAMMRYSGSGNSYLVDASTAGYTIGNNNTEASAVSQVNKGQITTYPFDLNTSAVDPGKSNSTITVATTHEQYYQLNMNSDNIVVWYCLSGSRFDATTPNDVTNSYYIYTMGNITYSGAGHSGGTTTTQEAMLFINTMVAAYRSATSEPTLAIKAGADGQVPSNSMFVTSDYQSGSLTASGDVSDGVVYFKVSDPSLSKDRSMYLFLQYAGLDDSGAVDASGKSGVLRAAVGGSTSGISIFSAATNQKVSALSGGLVYYVRLSEIPGFLDYFQNYSAVTLGLQLTTTAAAPTDIIASYNANATTESDIAFTAVRKIGLFPLS